MSPLLAAAIADQRIDLAEALSYYGQHAPNDGDILARAAVVHEAMTNLFWQANRWPLRGACILPGYRGGPGGRYSNCRPLKAAAEKLMVMMRGKARNGSDKGEYEGNL